MKIAGIHLKNVLYSIMLLPFLWLWPGQSVFAQGMVYHVSETGQ